VVRQCIFDCRWGRNFEFFSTPRLLVEECVITNYLDGSGSADGRAKLLLVRRSSGSSIIPLPECVV
jgi:hypothetical protein